MAKLVKVTQLNSDGTTAPVSDFYIDLKSGVLQFIKRIDGKYFARSTGVRFDGRRNPVPVGLVKKAKEAANIKLKRDVNSKKVRALISVEADSYLNLREQECSRGEIDPKTLGVIKRAMNRIKLFWGDMRPEEISRDSWQLFVEWHEGEYPGETLFNVKKYFRHFCRYLHERVVSGRSLLPAIPTLKDPNARRERVARNKRKERIFTDDEVTAILKACEDRDRLIVLLMYTMAFRISEACELDWKHLKLDAEDPHYIFDEENNKARLAGSQALHSDVYKCIQNIYKNGEWVFPQQRDVAKALKPQMIDWAKIKKDSGVTWPWSPHTFRHTCLTRLFSDPKLAQVAIMKCFRVSYKVALENYIHIEPATRATLRDAIKVGL